MKPPLKQRLRSRETLLPRFSLDRKITVLVLLATILVVGTIAALGIPLELIPRGLIYWPWLLWQILLSGLRVTRLILSPSLPISPTLVKVNARQDSSVGLVTYANSITLTPGTISIEASERGHCIWVHAIEREGAEGFQDDEMNAQVAWFDRSKA